MLKGLVHFLAHERCGVLNVGAAHREARACPMEVKILCLGLLIDGGNALQIYTVLD